MGVRGALLAAAAIIAPATAMAQSASDVVVMRRVLAPPKVDRDAQGYDQNQYHWETGSWTANTGCSAAVEQTRPVQCVRHHQNQPDAACGAITKPDATKSGPEYSTCGYSWQITGHGQWSSTCSATATRDTTAVCMRSDGTQMADDKCDAGSKPGPESAPNYSQCEGTWVPGEYTYQSTCSDSTDRVRNVACMKNGTTLPETQCATPDKPATVDPQGPFQVYSGCGYTWHLGAYGPYNSTCSATATRTRVNTCTRNAANNPVVDNSYCASANGAQSETDTPAGGVFTGCKSNEISNFDFETAPGVGTTAGWSGVTDTFCGTTSYGANGSTCVGRVFQGGTASQTISGLVVGKTYTLAFNMLGFSSYAGNTTVSFGAQSKTIVQTAFGTMTAAQKNTTFVATSSTMTLSFYAANNGFTFDQVKLAIIP